MQIPNALYNQPNGHCQYCRWNMASKPGGLDCGVPQTVLINPICIMKINTAWLSNIEWNQRRIDDEGESWKKEDAS